jgi:hypothetical protein
MAAGYADESISIARRRAEGRVALEAEAVMEAAKRQAAAPRPSRSYENPALAERFVRVLSAGREAALAG